MRDPNRVTEDTARRPQPPQVMVAMTSPAPIAAPSATFRALTLPDLWAVISFSIFIASITQIRSPSETSAPSATATLRIVP